MTGFAAALLIIKVSVLLAVALVAAFALGRSPAARRHRLWSATFLALVALPALAALLPALHVPVPAWRAAASPPALSNDVVAPASVAAVSSGRTEIASERAHTAAAPSTRGAITLPSARTVVLIVWLGGALAALVAFAVSLTRVRRLAAASTELVGADWRDAANRIARQLGLKRPVRVLASSAVSMPMAGGVVGPAVFLPADAVHWDPERREVVLAHEMAHLANGDPLRHLIGRVAFSLYWFHPLVWLAARKASAACEHACDDLVLALGVRPSTYARVLLDFAGTAPTPYVTAALPMATRTSLETRLMTILNDSSRPSAPRRPLVPAALLALLTFSIAAAEPMPPAPDEAPTSVVTALPIAPTSESQPKTREVAKAESREPASPQSREVTPAQSREMDCSWDRTDSRSFSGSMSTSRSGSSTIIHEQVGTRGSDHVIQKSFGDLRVCAVATDVPERRSDDPPSAWPTLARRVVLETRQSGEIRRMEIDGRDVSLTVNGRARDVDGATLAWRDALMDVLDRTWELSRLRGEASSLRGEISSIRGHVSSLRGSISSERGAISSLEASRRYRDSDERERIASRIRRHEDAIDGIEREIQRYDADARVREVERRIARLDVEGKVAAIEREIRNYDVEGRVGTINRRIDDLNVERRVSGIERDIGALDVERRSRALEARINDAVDRLRAALRR